MDVLHYGGLGLTGFAAGLLGALLGLGGGIFVVPALSLLFGVPPIVAAGTSSLAVITTSTTSAASYVHNRLANIRLGLVLLVSTTAAAVLSSLVASYIPARVLSGLFALVLLYTAFSIQRGSARPQNKVPVDSQAAEKDSSLNLQGSYYDAATSTLINYRPAGVRTGMLLNMFAGMLAGLLGVGGGIVQVPVMNLIMSVPLKAATATSSFMIGTTATSAAIVRYIHGDIDVLTAVPVVLCVFIGARVGAWLVPRTPTARLRQLFVPIAVIIAGLMLLQAAGIYSGR